MKKHKLSLIFILITLCIIVLVGCNGDPKDVSFTVKFDYGDNKVESVSVKENELAVKPENPTKVGYTFSYWKLDDKQFDFNTPIIKDITLTAVWVKNADVNFTVNFDYGDRIVPILVKENELVLKPEDPTKEGYRFSYWKLDESEFNFSTPITKNITLTIEWVKERQVKVIVDNKEQTYTIDDKASYTLADFNIVKTDASLVGFYTANNSDITSYDISKGIEKNVTLYADFMTDGLVVEGSEVTKYMGSSLDIIIPNFYNGIAITKIGADTDGVKALAGRNPDSIKEYNNIYISRNIEQIDAYTFTNTYIVNLVFDKNSKLKTIKSDAFNGAKGLTKIILPQSVTTIEQYAFAMCDDLEKVYIPSSVKVLSNYLCFNAMKENKSITIYLQGENIAGYTTENEWNFLSYNGLNQAQIKFVNDGSEIA